MSSSLQLRNLKQAYKDILISIIQCSRIKRKIEKTSHFAIFDFQFDTSTANLCIALFSVGNFFLDQKVRSIILSR